MGRRPRFRLDALSTWEKLNATLMSGDESDARVLLRAEMAGRKRKQFMLRIHSRLNYLRACRERQEIMEGLREAS